MFKVCYTCKDHLQGVLIIGNNYYFLTRFSRELFTSRFVCVWLQFTSKYDTGMVCVCVCATIVHGLSQSNMLELQKWH